MTNDKWKSWFKGLLISTIGIAAGFLSANHQLLSQPDKLWENIGMPLLMLLFSNLANAVNQLFFKPPENKPPEDKSKLLISKATGWALIVGLLFLSIPSPAPAQCGLFKFGQRCKANRAAKAEARAQAAAVCAVASPKYSLPVPAYPVAIGAPKYGPLPQPQAFADPACSTGSCQPAAAPWPPQRR